MFTLKIIFIALIATALAANDTTKPDVEVLTEKSFVNEDGYNFQSEMRNTIKEIKAAFPPEMYEDALYKLSDGISRQEQGQLITVGEHQGIGVKGSYSYVGPDGQEYTVTYTADDKGFNPVVRTSPAKGQ